MPTTDNYVNYYYIIIILYIIYYIILYYIILLYYYYYLFTIIMLIMLNYVLANTKLNDSRAKFLILSTDMEHVRYPEKVNSLWLTCKNNPFNNIGNPIYESIYGNPNKILNEKV